MKVVLYVTNVYTYYVLEFRIKPMEILFWKFFPFTYNFFHLINKKNPSYISFFHLKIGKMLPPTLLFWTPVVFGTLELVEILFIEFLFLIWILLSLKNNFHQFSRRLSESIIFQEKKSIFWTLKVVKKIFAIVSRKRIYGLSLLKASSYVHRMRVRDIQKNEPNFLKDFCPGLYNCKYV